MTEDEIFDIVQPIIVLVTGLPGANVILADPNQNAPSGAYASIRPVQNITERGQANVIRSSSPGVTSVGVDVRAQMVVTCSVNFYRVNAMSNAQKLKQCNKRPDVSAMLFTAGLGWNRAGMVNNLSSLQSNNYEQRSQVSLFLMYETTDPVTINSIEEVQYNVQYEDATVVASGEILAPDAP